MASSKARGKLCYIAGGNRGGSTLLAVLLDQHPRIITTGEAGPIRQVRTNLENDCSCGETLDDCPFYTEVGARLEQNSILFDPFDWQLRYEMPYPALDRLAFGLPPRGGVGLSRLRHTVLRHLPISRQLLATIDQRNLAFEQAALATADADAFVDATKDPERVRYLADIPVPLFVVHLVRDPRAVAFSGSRKGNDPLVIADYWKRTHDVLDAMKHYLPREGWISVRYEDLCQDPGTTLQPVFGLLGLDPILVSRDFTGSDHHMVGNRMRRAGSQTVRLDEEWKSEMTPKLMDAVWERTGSTARRYGYERDVSNR